MSTRIRSICACGLTVATLVWGCVEVDAPKTENKQAPAPAPAAPPPEPARSALAIKADSIYTIVAQAGQKCLQFASPADVAHAEIAACDGSKGQQFRLQPAAGGYHAVVNVQSNKCLDVPAFSMNDGEALVQYGCNGGTNQQWIVADGPGGAIRLVSHHSGKTLTADGDKTIAQRDWKSKANQQFKLALVEPPKEAPAAATGAGGASGAAGAGGKGGAKPGKPGKPAEAKPKAAGTH